MRVRLRTLLKIIGKRVLALSGFLLLSHSAFAELSLVDAQGTDVVMQAPAQRIVSLAPHITEVVYAAGAGARLVGTVTYSNYPEAALSVQRVGSYDSVSYEAVLALKPDLILAWGSGNGVAVAERLRALGLKVFVQEPKTLEDVAQTLRQVGQLAGTAEVAESAAGQFLAELARLRTKYSKQHSLSVYYQIWDDPLLTLNGEHLISDVIRLCGGQNAFSDALALVSRISVESVLRVDPDVIVASGMDEARPEWLDKWRDWESLSAVKNGHLYFVPPDLLQRHTPRIMQGAAMLCEHLESARSPHPGEL
jgi:iron complex transport system substrate-binding protein